MERKSRWDIRGPLTYPDGKQNLGLVSPLLEENRAWGIRGLVTWTKSKRVCKNIPCPSERGWGNCPSVGHLGFSSPSRQNLCKCGRSTVRLGVTGRRVCKVILFLGRMWVNSKLRLSLSAWPGNIQVHEIWGSPVCWDGIRVSVGDSRFCGTARWRENV